MQIVKITAEHLNKFPRAAEFVAMRTDCKMEVMMDAGQCVGGIIYSPTRIEYVFVEEAHRRGGYAKALVQHVVDCAEGQTVSVAIERGHFDALHLFLACGFLPAGFGYGWDDRRYVLTHDRAQHTLGEVESSHRHMRRDVGEIIKNMFVVETLPVRLTEGNARN